jgi:hypothetical protein
MAMSDLVGKAGFRDFNPGYRVPKRVPAIPGAHGANDTVNSR